MTSHFAAAGLVAVALLASGPGTAQTATEQPAPAATPSDQAVSRDTAPAAATGPKKEATEEIVVTGSRIRRKDLTTPAPVTVISREQVTASGKVSIGEFLQSLPEQGNAINTQVNNGGDGATRISLRGLGSARTLVLLNGRRMVPGGTGADASVDLNSIPTASVERIEVLKDGASAVYGSDAIAGVVNVVTRRGLKGTEASAYGGVSQHGDGQTYDLNVTTGQSGETGNVIFSAGYYKQQTSWAADRDFSKYQIFFDPKAPAGKGELLVGSGTIPAGRVVLSAADRACLATDPRTGNCTSRGDLIDNGNTAWSTLVTRFGKASQGVTAFMPCVPGDTNPECTDIGNGQRWRPYNGDGIPADPNSPGDQYNFQPQNYNVTPAQRISLYSMGDVNMGGSARGYYEASFVNRQSEQKLAAEPLITGSSGESILISKDNLYNPFGRDITDVRRRLLEFGNRITNQDITTFRVVGGLDGTMPEEFGPLHGWFWDISMNFGRTQEAGTKEGNIYLTQLTNALGPSMRDPTTGVPLCVSQPGVASTAIANCVPLDLFHGATYTQSTGAVANGSITPDQVTPLTFTGADTGINQMTAVQVNTSGELFQLFADRPVGLALGYEYRLLYGSAVPDPITVAGLTSGTKGLITKGGYHANEGYAELSIPVVSNLPLAESIEATAAARIFNYSTFGTDWTYKLGGRWRPIRDVTMRGTYSTAFRAPSVGELYGGQTDNFAAVNDPCKGGTPGSAKFIDPNSALGQSCGVAANNLDDQTQLKSRIGGNPALTPETAKVFTVGAVLEPSMLRGFSITVDYYNFNVNNSISTVGEAVILSSCYPNQGSVAPRYCDLVQRDPTNHRISQIFNLNSNVGGFLTDGVDLALRYGLPTSYGRFGFVFDGTWLHKFDVTQADGSVLHGRGVYDLAPAGFGGAVGNGGVFPAFKAVGGVTYGRGGLNVGLNERFIGSYWECAGDSGLMDGSGLCNGSQGGHADLSRKVDPYFQTDLYASYALNSGLGKTTLALGLNNALNASPPRVYNAFTPTSDPTAYDFLGRFFWGRVTQAF
ncbi:MAG TPA: TonB-dependent receptor [Myxococcales bacterium]|nr:TonB-dependent receptor [Myxococcales bacterium]